MLIFPFFISFIVFGFWWFLKYRPIETIVLNNYPSSSNRIIHPSVPAKQESPITSSFKENISPFVTLVLQPKQKNSTYTAEDVLAAFDEAEPKCFISKVTLRDMDLKTFAVPVLNGIIERMHDVRSKIIKNDPTLLNSFRNYFLKEFKQEYEIRFENEKKFIYGILFELKKGFRPTTNDIKNESVLRSYCQKNRVYRFFPWQLKSNLEVINFEDKFILLALKIAKNYAKIDFASKPSATDYFNSEMDNEGEILVNEYMEAKDMDLIGRYFCAILNCFIFRSKFQYLLNDPMGKVQPIQEIKAYLKSQKRGNFSVVYDELKRMLTEFIDKVHNAGMNENAPDDIYLETFNEFNMKFSDKFELGFETIRWDPDSVKEASDDELGKPLMHSLKNRNGYVKSVCFDILYPKNEKKESVEMK